MMFDFIVSSIFWPLSIALPLYFQSTEVNNGLYYGLCSVFLGQCITIGYFVLYDHKTKIQEVSQYNIKEAIIQHIFQLEGFSLLFLYLCVTWNYHLLPNSYYQNGTIQYERVFLQLLCQDFIQYIMHRTEHDIKWLYVWTHKNHHVYVKPNMFHSFQGSIGDTIVMIIMPLYITSCVIPVNMWSYMVFGTLYANMLTLIHSEYKHPWDDLFIEIGFGTPYDHHAHHKYFKYNFGHLFMYWDVLFGTRRIWASEASHL